jgi:hypothetical protein
MNAQFEQAQQLGSMWLEMWTKMIAAGSTMDPQQPPPDAARHLRNASLEVISQQTDAYMRSPQFLQMMKQSLDAQIAFRTQLNDFFTQAHHGVQGVAKQDVDELILSLRHMETRVLDRIEHACERLDRLARRLEAAEAHANVAGGNGNARSDATAPAAGGASEDDSGSEPGME